MCCTFAHLKKSSTHNVFHRPLLDVPDPFPSFCSTPPPTSQTPLPVTGIRRPSLRYSARSITAWPSDPTHSSHVTRSTDASSICRKVHVGSCGAMCRCGSVLTQFSVRSLRRAALTSAMSKRPALLRDAISFQGLRPSLEKDCHLSLKKKESLSYKCLIVSCSAGLQVCTRSFGLAPPKSNLLRQIGAVFDPKAQEM